MRGRSPSYLIIEGKTVPKVLLRQQSSTSPLAFTSLTVALEARLPFLVRSIVLRFSFGLEAKYVVRKAVLAHQPSDYAIFNVFENYFNVIKFK